MPFALFSFQASVQFFQLSTQHILPQRLPLWHLSVFPAGLNLLCKLPVLGCVLIVRCCRYRFSAVARFLRCFCFLLFQFHPRRASRASISSCFLLIMPLLHHVMPRLLIVSRFCALAVRSFPFCFPQFALPEAAGRMSGKSPIRSIPFHFPHSTPPGALPSLFCGSGAGFSFSCSRLSCLGVHDIRFNGTCCYIAEVADPPVGSFVCLGFCSHMFISPAALWLSSSAICCRMSCCRSGFSGSPLAFQFPALLFNLCHGVVNGLCIQARNVRLCFLPRQYAAGCRPVLLSVRFFSFAAMALYSSTV